MAVSELPGNPTAVWTVRKRSEGKLLVWWNMKEGSTEHMGLIEIKKTLV